MGPSNATPAVNPAAAATWLRRNERLLRISAGLFLLNQFIEFLIVQLGAHHYLALCSFDCQWYADIVEHGYDLEIRHSLAAHPRNDAANWVFFPALPLAARALHLLGGYAGAASLLMVGKLFFLLSIFAFVKLAAAYRPQLSPVLAAAVLALNPYSIYGNVGYTEPLFLLLSCTFFLALRRDALAAGAAGCLLACTRVVGVFAVLPYVIAMLGRWRRRPDQRERIVLGLMLIPFGLGLFLLFLHRLSGDALAFSHLQRAWNRFPGNPLSNVLDGLHLYPIDKYWALMCLLALLVPVYFALRKEFELAVFSLLCTLLPLSTGLWAMPRYIWWQAPVLLALAVALSRKKLWVLFFVAALPGLAYMYTAWFAGQVFVV